MEFLPHFNQSASGSVEQLPPQTALSDAMDAAEVVEDLVYIEWLQSEFLKVQSSSLGSQAQLQTKDLLKSLWAVARIYVLLRIQVILTHAID